MSTLLLVGATGLVGSAVRDKALDDPRVEQLVALSRRQLPPAARLHNHVVDFDRLTGDEPWWSVDAVICTLGTTRAKAGSRKAFRRVDHDYPLAVAKYARAAGTPAFVLTSALGASTRAPFFYSRTKGELERDVRACRYPSLTIVRPSLIGGERPERRPAEQLALRLTDKFERLLPPRWRVSPATRIAATLLEAAVSGVPGTRVVEADQITDWPAFP